MKEKQEEQNQLMKEKQEKNEVHYQLMKEQNQLMKGKIESLSKVVEKLTHK